ncbi:hypothetical protein D3C72_2101410 [compost metagenome]
MVDRLVLVESPRARADLRFGAVGGLGQEAAVGGAHDHGRARLAAAFGGGDAGRVDPRVAAQQGFFLAGFQGDGVHVGMGKLQTTSN